VRIHLGHHFYGAGNLGDEFMVAGFLAAMRSLAPDATFTSCVPFPLDPLRQRFPRVDWQPYSDENRETCIRDCDAWLGLGGSPFQSEQSRWFVDHLIGEAARCSRHGKPMFYLGIGVQTAGELSRPDIRELCTQAAAIWTRDEGSAERLTSLRLTASVRAAADLAHIFFQNRPPPAAEPRRLTVVANFDYAGWPGGDAFLAGIERIQAREHVWLAQESRELPGAEKALFAALSPTTQQKWRFVSPEIPGAPLHEVLARWPSGEWLVTARFHAALAGGWAGSKVVVISTNEKLRGVAQELGAPSVAPDATSVEIERAIQAATVAPRPVARADRAFEACGDFVRAVRSR
jgi:polysaccharide pyruvyl transferase WcaK-like protein